MSFLLPLGLLALLTLPIILLLHLIRERRRRVAVPSLLHWMLVPRIQTEQRMQQLPLTLLLLLHLLAATLLGLALGQPQLPGAFSNQVEQTVLVLDNSTSMAAQEGNTTRLQQAQSQARQILRGMTGADRATLIAAAPVPQVIASGNPADLAALEAALDGLQPGGTSADLESALTLAEATLDPTRAGRIVVLTDGTTPVADRRVIAPVEWQQIGAALPNRAIIAFAARPTGGALQVYARIANYGATPFRSAVRLYGDDQRLETRDIDIAATGESELTWRLPGSYQALRLEIDGGDALPLDDQAFLTVTSARPANVLLVSATPSALQRAFEAVPGVAVAVVAPGSYAGATAAQQAADLTVFDSYLPEELPSSSVLAINPPPGNPLITVRELPDLIAQQELTQQGATVQGLSFGGVRFDSARAIDRPEWAEVQLAADGIPLILRGHDATREVAIWTFDLTVTNLSTRLAFPLLVSRTVRDLTTVALPPAIQSGAALTMRPGPRTTAVEVTAPDGSTQRFAGTALVTLDTLTQPGWYRVVEQGATGPVFESQIAVNAGSVLESDLQPGAAPELVDTSAAADERGAAGRATDLWPWLALAALVILALEWGYILR